MNGLERQSGTRREWLAASSATALGMLSGAGCRRRGGTGYAGYALVATAGEESAAVVDLLEFRLLQPIVLGARPTAIVPGTGGNAYVLTPDTGSVHLVSNRLTVTRTRRLAAELSAVRWLPGKGGLVAISDESGELLSAHGDTLAVERKFALKEKPRTMDVFGDETQQKVATSSGPSGTVELFDLQSGQRWMRRLGSELGDLRFRADGQMLLVADLAGRALTALSVPQLEVVAQLPLAMRPENLCFNRDFGQLFVSGAGMDGVGIVFPYRVLQVDQTVLAGRDPGVMACSDNPSLLFVGSASGSDVCILNIDTRKVVGLVDVAQKPAYITITPDDQYALVLNRASGDVAFIRIPAIRVNPAIVISKLGASLFTMLSVGREPVHAAVVARTI